MKMIKLSGRELAVLRAIDTIGTAGSEIMERTQIAAVDLAEILAALCDIGYVEAYLPGAHVASMRAVSAEELPTARFEINPSYAYELKKATARR